MVLAVREMVLIVEMQVLFEIPCNIVLKRTTPRFWLPTLMLLWGIVATLMGIATTFGGFIAARFFLGVTESGMYLNLLFRNNKADNTIGLFPGVVFYLSMWYKRTETHFRISLFFSAASLAGAFGGILAYGIGFMNNVGGLKGWQVSSTPSKAANLADNALVDFHTGRTVDCCRSRFSLFLHPQLSFHRNLHHRR